jgi:transcriptional regulator with XRE-family HTH domain
MDIASRLDMEMVAAGFRSQNTLALKSGVSQATVNRILKGKGNYPDAVTLYKLAKVCNVSVEWLVTGETTEEGGVILMYVTSKETRLLTINRQCNEDGQAAILIAAEVAKQISPSSGV